MKMIIFEEWIRQRMKHLVRDDKKQKHENDRQIVYSYFACFFLLFSTLISLQKSLPRNSLSVGFLLKIETISFLSDYIWKLSKNFENLPFQVEISFTI